MLLTLNLESVALMSCNVHQGRGQGLLDTRGRRLGRERMVFMFFETNHLKDDEIQLSLHHTCESDPSRFGLPVYYFRICDKDNNVVGWCDLRIGHNACTPYLGHIGYQVEAPFRGHHYAGRAVKLLLQLAKQHAMPFLTITCAPENTASRKTCEYAGGKFMGIVEVPEEMALQYNDAVRKSCVYQFDVE